MESKIVYELPMFSSLLIEPPSIEFKGVDIILGLKGYDSDDVYSEVSLKFNFVIELRKTSTDFSFTRGAYDKVVEIFDSNLLFEFRKKNEVNFKIRSFRNFILYLDDWDFFEILCSDFEVISEEINDRKL